MVAYSFQRRFSRAVELGVKRQTIRAIGGKRHARPGEMIQLYTGLRTAEARKLGEARCSSTANVRIWQNKVEIDEGMDIVTREIRTEGGLLAFAKEDGFDSWQEMAEFFADPDEPWRGVLIRWERPVAP